MNYYVVYWETNAFVLTIASAEAIKFCPLPVSKPGSTISPARSGSYFLASILVSTSVPRRRGRVHMPLGINAGRVSLIVCSNTFGHNWTLTSNNDFVLITKAGTFLLIYAEIHSSQTTIIAARLSQVGRVLIYWAQGRASQPFAASEEKWRRSLIPMGYNTRLNLKSSLIVSRLPSCYAG